MTMPTDDLDVILRAKEAHQWDLLRRDGVGSVGIGRRQRGGERTDELAILVGVEVKRDRDELDTDEFLPSELEAGDSIVRVDVVEVGRTRLLAPDLTRYRPVIGGALYSRGTVTGIVTDRLDRRTVYLGCLHSMIPGSWDRSGAFTGDPAVISPGNHWQPEFDAANANILGRPKRLARSVGVTFFGRNWILVDTDAAIGTLDEGDVPTGRPAVEGLPNVQGIGSGPTMIADPFLGQRVRVRQAKSGRTLQAEVVETHTLWKPPWRVQRAGEFTFTQEGWVGFRPVVRQVVVMNSFRLERILTTEDVETGDVGFGIGGDSGSPIYDADSVTALGLLAGASKKYNVGYACTISLAFRALDVVPFRCGILLSVLEGSLRLRGLPSDRRNIDAAEVRLRPLLGRVLPERPAGQALIDAVFSGPNALVDALVDVDAFGSAVRLFAPWVAQATLFETLEAELEQQQIDAAYALADRLAATGSSAASTAAALAAWLGPQAGRKLREILTSDPAF